MTDPTDNISEEERRTRDWLVPPLSVRELIAQRARDALLAEQEREQERAAADLVQALNAIDASDPERAHGQADEILLAAVHAEVAAAYRRLIDRARWWATV